MKTLNQFKINESKEEQLIQSKNLEKCCKENMEQLKWLNYIEFLNILPINTTGVIQIRIPQENNIFKLNEVKN
jgi:hypothetical protein